MSEGAQAEWPAKFIYVVNAGGAAAVNLGPLRSAGRNRIAGVMILCAAADHANPSAEDLRNAIAPMRRLRQFAATELGLPDQAIRVIEGHPDRFGDWEDALNEASARAEELGVAVVYNVSSGRKQSLLGALLGHRPGRALPLLISIDLASPHARLLTLRPGGGFDERTLPVERRIDLATYLASYGYAERDRPARVATMERMIRAAPLAKAMFDAVRESGSARRGLASLYRSLHGVTRKEAGGLRHGQAVAVRLEPDALAFLSRFEEVAALDGVSVRRSPTGAGEAHFTAIHAYEFLTGGWLEAVALKRLEAAANRLGDVEIVAAMDIGIAGTPPAGPRVITEFDIIVYGNDRLDIVEIKAVVADEGLRHEAIDRLAQYKNELAGPGGRAWLVAPFIDLHNDRRDLAAHARTAGVGMVTGPDAVDRIVELVAESRRLPSRE